MVIDEAPSIDKALTIITLLMFVGIGYFSYAIGEVRSHLKSVKKDLEWAMGKQEYLTQQIVEAGYDQSSTLSDILRELQTDQDGPSRKKR